MRDILIIGLMIGVVIILIRVIFGSPLITRVRESFASGPSSNLINSSTECPPGSQLYMYEGRVFCCSGTINTDASRPADTCSSLYTGRDKTLTFCTLGPSTQGIKNCLELRSGLMQAEGEKYCNMVEPTFVKGPPGSDTANGRCCADPGNPGLTECSGKIYCDVSTDSNLFLDPKSCQFLKAQQDAPDCPKNYGPFTAAGQGPMANLTLFGCTDNGQNCYADSTLKRLKELGYDVTGLTSCSLQGK